MAKKRTGQSLKDLLKGEVNTKTPRGQSTKTSKRQDAKTSKNEKKKLRHTIYLFPEASRKLRLYAAERRMRLNEVIEKLINDNL
ncbi:hypothetical protein ES702_07852 [subsurface metagenome]